MGFADTYICRIFLRKKPSWLKYYFLITGMLSTILLIGFAWWPQQMNSALVLLLIIIVFRSIHQYLKLSYAKNHFLSGSTRRI
jgi:hypothetical protein